MSKKVTLCNSEGERLCGSDGHIPVDGRFSLFRVRADVVEYRERYRKHFAWKAEYWTHFYFDNQPGKLYSID
jgi:hypothetical protein